MRVAMPSMPGAKQPITQRKQRCRCDYGAAEIGGSDRDHVSEPPLHRLIEGMLVAGIPERLPSTLDAGRGECDADDAVDQAQPTPRGSSRRRKADDQDSRDHCDRQNQLNREKGGLSETFAGMNGTLIGRGRSTPGHRSCL
jgi:hypothetical protein